MFFLRTLIFVAIAALLFFWLRRTKTPNPAPPTEDAPVAQALLRCSFCAVNFPASDAVTVGREVYCCEAHRIAAKDV